MREQANMNRNDRPTNTGDTFFFPDEENLNFQEIMPSEIYPNNPMNIQDGPFGINFMEMYPDAINNYTGSFSPILPFANTNDMISGLNTPQPTATLDATFGIKAEDVTSTSSPLPCNEDKVDLSQFTDNSSIASRNNSSPPLTIGFKPWIGDYNFRVTIPAPAVDSCGVKPSVQPKYTFSNITNKLYVAKNRTFPVCVTLDHYPEGALLIMCPVYTDPTYRMSPVYRCPNCSWTDQNIAIKNHVLQVESLCGPTYFNENKRYMVSVPLGVPAPGNESVHLFLKFTCNTSCVGGPSRKPFSIVFTLKVREHVIGRQVIDTKCCEGPNRDKKHDETAVALRTTIAQNNTSAVIRGIGATPSKGKKRKRTQEKLQIVTDEEHDELKVPKVFSKKVKKFINMLYKEQESRKLNLGIKKYYPSEESE